MTLGILAAGLLAAAFCCGSAMAAPFDCGARDCGVPPQDPYPHYVIGPIDGLGEGETALRLFREARDRGRWAGLPDDAATFAETILPVSIRLTAERSLTVLMGWDEARAIALKTGDFVRFSPHRGRYEQPTMAAAYWRAIGCVAVLCRAGDQDCVSRYRGGLYRTTDGVALDEASQQPLPHGVTIDIGTMLPTSHGTRGKP